jgi:pimeloyl-ACP methyl ester carboxylesterase
MIGFSLNPVAQPTGCILFDNEIARPPRAWAEPIYNIVQWTRAAGGHFAALENPEVLAKDIASFSKLI